MPAEFTEKKTIQHLKDLYVEIVIIIIEDSARIYKYIVTVVLTKDYVFLYIKK